MKNNNMVLSIIALSFLIPVGFADGILPAKPILEKSAPVLQVQAVEIVMPDGTKQKGFIQDGHFIPIGAPPVSPANAPSQVAPLDAHIKTEQNINANTKSDQTINQNTNSVIRVEHDKVDTVTKYAQTIFGGLGTLGGMFHH